ncbi:MAG TPA: metallophosphoesterase [Propionicimonas sp.]|uniref:metallophosphoesterase n=1 Tax=Propionicimonas sp. TaxID=1955623 RepID=UPI002F3F64EA
MTGALIERRSAARGGAARALLCGLLVTFLALGFVPVEVTAASRTLTLTPGSDAGVSVGKKRLTSIAAATVTVPASGPVEVGLQLRASGPNSGYRALISFAADGTVSGAFRKVDGGTETALGTPTVLAFQARARARVHLEAAVVGTRVVKLYLRAWLHGQPKPSMWLASAGDASDARLTSAGSTYLWARSGAPGPVRLAYEKTTSKPFSAARALKIGLGDAGRAAAAGGGQDTFSIAVIPDTQAETNNVANTPFLNRTRWLATNRAAFDLRYVLHTGDVTNWGWLDPGQLSRARAAMNVLTAAGLPFAVTVGNHDTAAVGWNGVRGSTGYGGSAYMYNPECKRRLGAAACKSWLLVRRTEAFNRTFPLSAMGGVGGQFAAGLTDNYWTTFRANDTDWLVLTLELWPRTGVVDWARDVVASHPGHNVIIQTHNYLTGAGRIAASNGGYGATSPRYLYDKVVSRYGNVKLVLSGHTGGFTSRTDTNAGNTVISYLGNDLGGPSHNPVRVLTINTSTGDVTSTVYDPIRHGTAGTSTNAIAVIR